MSEDKATYSVAKTSALPIVSMSEIAQAGQLIAQSGMFGINNAAAGFVVVATCQQMGISLMDFVRTYYMINNKPSMRSDAMLAEFRKRGGKHKIIENSVDRASVELSIDGNTQTFSYSMEDAKRTGDCFDGNGKVKHNWQHRADDMLWARVISRGVRRMCPEIVSGLYTPEEVQDFSHDVEPTNKSPEKRIDAKEIKSRIVNDVESVESIELHEAIDANTCPMGGDAYCGIPWAALDDAVLECALEYKGSEMTDAHRQAVRSEMNRRKEGEV